MAHIDSLFEDFGSNVHLFICQWTRSLLLLRINSMHVNMDSVSVIDSVPKSRSLTPLSRTSQLLQMKTP